MLVAEELRERLTGENAASLTKQLRDYEVYVSKANELKAWSFLETRIQLLLKAYVTTLKVCNTCLIIIKMPKIDVYILCTLEGQIKTYRKFLNICFPVIMI